MRAEWRHHAARSFTVVIVFNVKLKSVFIFRGMCVWMCEDPVWPIFAIKMRIKEFQAHIHGGERSICGKKGSSYPRLDLRPLHWVQTQPICANL